MPHSPVPAESLTPEQRALLATRYGGRRSASWLIVTAITVTVALFLGWVIWAGLGQADQEVRWRTVGYSGARSDAVTVEFDVFKPADRDVECTVRALDIDGNEVGRAEVPVTSTQSDVNVVYDLAVTDRPITAEVLDCRLQS